MAQNVNPASSSSSGYEKDAMERNSATSSSQVRIWQAWKVVRAIFLTRKIPVFLNQTNFLKLGEQATATGANVTNDVRR